MRRLILVASLMLLIVLPAFADRRHEGDAESVTTARRSPAEMRADQLDFLFARLHVAKSSDDAGPVEQKIWQLWMSSDSPTAEVLLNQATLAMADRANAQSLAILNQLVVAYPQFAEAWNKRATLYFNMGRYDESLADIDKVLALEPRHFGALSGRGMILLHQRKYSAALEAYKEALEMNPSLEIAKEAVKALEKLQQPI